MSQFVIFVFVQSLRSSVDHKTPHDLAQPRSTFHFHLGWGLNKRGVEFDTLRHSVYEVYSCRHAPSMDGVHDRVNASASPKHSLTPAMHSQPHDLVNPSKNRTPMLPCFKPKIHLFPPLRVPIFSILSLPGAYGAATPSTVRLTASPPKCSFPSAPRTCGLPSVGLLT